MATHWQDVWSRIYETNEQDEALAATEASSGQDGGIVITIASDGAAERGGADESVESEAVFEPDAAEAAFARVNARILWPAVGFPAIVAPRAGATGTPLADGDATRCITVLLVSDHQFLGKEDAARYLRCVRWRDRARRHIPEGAEGCFRWQDLEVRNDAGTPSLNHFGAKDVLGELIGWGGDREHSHAVAGNLAAAVTRFYRDQGLRHLHEIRVSEQASAALGTGTFHLFWNNQLPGEDAPSDEMALLLGKFVTGRRSGLGASWQGFQEYFRKEYEYQYRPLHPADGRPSAGPRSEILHPVCIRKQGRTSLRVGHVTDLHCAVRNDVYQRNLEAEGKQAGFNNWNVSAAACYAAAGKETDIVLLTGDLIDYGRGFLGRDRKLLGRDDQYHVDRNWFYFLDMLASGDAYRTPAYTILGNHDWRINPYPPFAIAGAPAPRSYFHDHQSRSLEEQKGLLRTAHGPGYDRLLSYRLEAESLPERDPWRDLVTIVKGGIRWTAKWAAIGWTLRSAVGDILLNTSTLDMKDLPTETTVRSVEWYLMAINPFLDYIVQLPSGHQLLMLDWAEDEDVLFPVMQGGKAFPYLPWQAASASDPGPKARRCLTALQKSLVTTFLEWTGPKLIGIHAPPIGPYPDWLDGHMLAGRATYVTHSGGKPVADVARARGPTNFATRYPDGRIEPWLGHPFFAVRPKSGAEGMVPDYGSFDSGREWFIVTVTGRSDVRAVFSGHIHRSGLYVVYRAPATDGPAIAGQLMVRGLLESQVAGVRAPRVSNLPHGASGPLFVNTTSAGPRGHDKRRSETATERAHGGLTADPGYARLAMAADGSIERVAFGSVVVGVSAPARTPEAVEWAEAGILHQAEPHDVTGLGERAGAADEWPLDEAVEQQPVW